MEVGNVPSFGQSSREGGRAERVTRIVVSLYISKIIRIH